MRKILIVICEAALGATLFAPASASVAVTCPAPAADPKAKSC